MPTREMGRCDRTGAWCNCSGCADHCAHVCAENGGECCMLPDEALRPCPFCGERAEGCACYEETHGG